MKEEELKATVIVTIRVVVVSRWSCFVGVVSGTVELREDLKKGGRT